MEPQIEEHARASTAAHNKKFSLKAKFNNWKDCHICDYAENRTCMGGALQVHMQKQKNNVIFQSEMLTE
jgi:hypothetical protein